MKIIIVDDYNQMSRLAAECVSNLVLSNPKAVLGLPTGSTPLGMYRCLIEMHRKNNLSFKHTVSFNLDEYVGLCKNHPNDYSYFMSQNFFSYIDIQKENINIPSGISQDLQKECIDYDKQIEKRGGIDLMILGLGVNGHIGFNEPSDCFSVSTHVVRLADETVEANSRFFESVEEVPRFAITMGIGGIMKSKKILLLANGSQKAWAIKKVLQGQVKPSVPGSILRLHPNVTVILDTLAGACLDGLD